MNRNSLLKLRSYQPPEIQVTKTRKPKRKQKPREKNIHPTKISSVSQARTNHPKPTCLSTSVKIQLAKGQGDMAVPESRVQISYDGKT